MLMLLSWECNLSCTVLDLFHVWHIVRVDYMGSLVSYFSNLKVKDINCWPIWGVRQFCSFRNWRGCGEKEIVNIRWVNHEKFYVPLTPGCSETEGGRNFWSGIRFLLLNWKWDKIRFVRKQFSKQTHLLWLNTSEW